MEAEIAFRMLYGPTAIFIAFALLCRKKRTGSRWSVRVYSLCCNVLLLTGWGALLLPVWSGG